MNSFLNRLYLSTFVSSFGNWLTFLAIALIVKEHYGGQHVAWVFLAQTLPVLIFSRSLAKLIPAEIQGAIFFWCHILLSLNSLLLCFFTSLPFIYFHLFVGAMIKSVSNPLLNTLIGKWSPEEKTIEVFTRVGSIQTATLALAPALGAWLKIATSANFLFLVDAIFYVGAVTLIADRLLIKKTLTKSIESSLSKVRSALTFKDLFSSMARIPSGVPKNLWISLSAWFGFLALGALLNALEFARFEQLQMSETQIGQIMAAWGVGSLFAFIFKKSFSAFASGLIFLLSLVVFLVVPSVHLVLASFCVGGWSASLFSGALRAGIQQSVPHRMETLPIWSFANQVTQGINLIAYVGVGLLLSTLGYKIFAVLVIVIGAATLVAISGSNLLNKVQKAKVQS